MHDISIAGIDAIDPFRRQDRWRMDNGITSFQHFNNYAYQMCTHHHKCFCHFSRWTIHSPISFSGFFDPHKRIYAGAQQAEMNAVRCPSSTAGDVGMVEVKDFQSFLALRIIKGEKNRDSNLKILIINLLIRAIVFLSI